jgi:hypothetical protein
MIRPSFGGGLGTVLVKLAVYALPTPHRWEQVAARVWIEATGHRQRIVSGISFCVAALPCAARRA